MAETPPPGEQRIDKWLWHARMTKTRTLASRLVAGGRVRLNKIRMTKPGHAVRIGDIISVPQGDMVRVLKVVGFSERRGAAAEARNLYEDMEPAGPPEQPEPLPGGKDARLRQPAGKRAPGAGRPTKRERRAIDRLIDKDHGGD